MKEKFKVGDKVRIIKNTNSSNNKIGDEGIITEITFAGDQRGYRVEVEDGKTWGNWSSQEEIELVEQDKQEIQDLKNRLDFVHESSAKAIELVEALQLQTKGTYNEDTIRQALLRLTLVNPVHLEMTSNGHGEFPDGYKLTGKGIDYIVEQLKK
jgi:hypothetical protein